jgi:hypothetical protein
VTNAYLDIETWCASWELAIQTGNCDVSMLSSRGVLLHLSIEVLLPINSLQGFHIATSSPRPTESHHLHLRLMRLLDEFPFSRNNARGNSNFRKLPRVLKTSGRLRFTLYAAASSHPECIHSSYDATVCGSVSESKLIWFYKTSCASCQASWLSKSAPHHPSSFEVATAVPWRPA